MLVVHHLLHMVLFLMDMQELQSAQEEWGLSDTDVVGPAPAWPAMLRGHHRWHIILRGPNPRSLLDKITIRKGWAVDIDPVSLS